MKKSTLLRLCLAGSLLVSSLSCTLEGVKGLTGDKPKVGQGEQQKAKGVANALHAEMYMLEKFMETVTTDLVWKTIIAQNIIWTPEVEKEVGINPVLDSEIEQYASKQTVSGVSGGQNALIASGPIGTQPVSGLSTKALSPDQLQKLVDAVPKGTFTLVYDGVRGYKIKGVERNTPPDATVLKYDGGPLNTLVTKFKGAKVEQRNLEENIPYNVLVSLQTDDGIDLWGKPTRETSKTEEIQKFVTEHPEQVATLLEVTNKVVDKTIELAKTYGKDPEKVAKAEQTIALVRDVVAAAKEVQGKKEEIKQQLLSQANNPALQPIINYVNTGSTGDSTLDEVLKLLFPDGSKKYKDIGFGDENNPSKISYELAAKTERNKDINEVTIKTFIPKLKADFAFDPDIYDGHLQAIIKASCEKMNLAISGDIVLIFPTIYKTEAEAKCKLVLIQKTWNTYKTLQPSPSPSPSGLETKALDIPKDRPIASPSASPSDSKDREIPKPSSSPDTEVCSPATESPFSMMQTPAGYQITYTQHIDTVKDITYNEALNNALATLSELSGVEIPAQEPILNCTKPSITPSILPSGVPYSLPSTLPSGIPSGIPSVLPSGFPSILPSLLPSLAPSTSPTATATATPTPTSTPTATSTTTRTPQSYPVNIVETFNPTSLNIYVGDTVVWKNNAILAAKTLQSAEALFTDHEIAKNGGTYSYTFNTVGNYTFKLKYYPSASMTVTVAN